jgi:hypothetical protein
MEKNDRIYLLTYDVRRTLEKLLAIDTLPGNEKAQKIFLQWARQKFQEDKGDVDKFIRF